MFPAGTQQCVCGGRGGGTAGPPEAPSDPGTLRSPRSTCWDVPLCSKTSEGGAGNQEMSWIHNQEAWLSKHKGAARANTGQNYLLANNSRLSQVSRPVQLSVSPARFLLSRPLNTTPKEVKSGCFQDSGLQKGLGLGFTLIGSWNLFYSFTTLTYKGHLG